MNIELKIDYEEVVKHYNEVVKRFQELAQKKLIIKVKEDVYYDDGTKVDEVAFWLEYGNEEFNVHYPSRPFWRNAFAKYEDIVQKRFEANLQAVIEGKISVYRCYEGLGELVVKYIEKEIKSGNFQPLAESTIKRKEKLNRESPTTPLIDTKLLYNSITFEVV